MPSKICLGAAIAAIFIVSAATAPSANAAPPDDACALLTQAQVSAALGVSVDPGTHLTPTSMKTCMWNEANAPMMGRKSVGVSLKTVDGYNSSKKLMEQTAAQMKAEKDADAGQLEVTPISGIGDDAYYASMGVHPNLSVKKGNVAINVEVFGDFPPDQVKAMEKTLALRILSKL